jgi:hypothetical protein
MTQIPLVHLAHARSGDKGDSANIGLVAYDDEAYRIIVAEVTAERVRQHFETWVYGPVERYKLPNLRALNFVLRQALDGGGTVSLRTDAQGKVLGSALLRMMVEVPEEVAIRVQGRGRVPPGWTLGEA